MYADMLKSDGNVSIERCCDDCMGMGVKLYRYVHGQLDVRLNKV